MDKNRIVEDLRAFLVDRFPRKHGLASLDADANLQDSGIDSLDTIELINHVEKAYALKVERFEGTYFDTLARIAELILSKRS